MANKVSNEILQKVCDLKYKGLTMRQTAKELTIKYNTVRTALERSRLVHKSVGVYEPPHKKEISFDINEKGCHICTSHALSSGYPVFHRDRKKVRIFRYLFEKKNGKIPKGLCVRHKCDNKLCINTDHLLLGSIADNNKDTLERSRYHRKLSKFQVLEIKVSNLPSRKLAKLYNVSKTHILHLKKK